MLDKTGIHMEPQADGALKPIPIAHNGVENANPDSTLRTGYTNLPEGHMGSVGPAGMLLKHVYERKADGSRGRLLKIYGMHKQNEGYFDQGGDWEYVVINAGTATEANPNGTVEGIEDRGKIKKCVDCHSQAKNDFCFTFR